MKFAISNIAWKAEEDEQVYEIMRQYPRDYGADFLTKNRLI